MALSEDQKAMLRLLAQREQGYEDLAALMGLSVAEVRTKVREALEEIDRAAPGVEPSPAPRQSEPQRADEISPEPVKPAPMATPEPPRASAPSPKAAPAKSAAKALLPADRRLRIGGAAAGAVLLVFIVLLVAGVFGGGEASDPADDASTDTPSTTTASSEGLTQAVLSPVNGGDAGGRALFGRVRNTAVLQVEAEGLDPSPRGASYTIWLYRSPKVVLRIGAVKVGESGGISAQLPVPAEVLAYVAGGAFDQIDISLTPDTAYEAEVAEAKKEKRLPAYTGTDVLRGKITGRLVEGSASGG